MSTTTLVTADNFARMSFDGPVELVQGEVVYMRRPSGVHGVICFNVAALLARWVESRDVYQVVINDTGVVTVRDPDTVRGPDVFVVRRDQLPDGIPQGNFPIPPELCIEVNSPHDRWSEVIAKVGEYMAAGVPEVWVVDSPTRQVHLYRSDAEPTQFGEGDTIQSTILPEFQADVTDLFRGL